MAIRLAVPSVKDFQLGLIVQEASDAQAALDGCVLLTREEAEKRNGRDDIIEYQLAMQGGNYFGGAGYLLTPEEQA